MAASFRDICPLTRFFPQRSLSHEGPAPLLLPIAPPRGGFVHKGHSCFSTARKPSLPRVFAVFAGQVRGDSNKRALPKLITVLGKGGSGKTTTAVYLAKLLSSSGTPTCLVLQGCDRVAEGLLGMQLTSSLTRVGRGGGGGREGEENGEGPPLWAVRLETSKLLAESLALLKKADNKLGISKGALDEISGEELSVLPGMDSLVAMAALERIAKPAGGLLDFIASSSTSARGLSFSAADTAEVVIFDGPSNGEVLRIFAAPQNARWYLRRFRALAERTDVGRMTLPTVARVIDSFLQEAAAAGGGSSSSSESERSSSQIWEALDDILGSACSAFADPSRVAGVLVTRYGEPASTQTAARLWGSALQSGFNISDLRVTPPAGGVSLRDQELESGSAAFSLAGDSELAERFSPLRISAVPEMESASDPVQVEGAAQDVRPSAPLFSSNNAHLPRPVVFDPAARTARIFLPGFSKSEIKLSQWRGGAELLIEAGDQRRSIQVPVAIRGKVAGAKFQGGFLIISLKPS